jgi:hypothetical protein
MRFIDNLVAKEGRESAPFQESSVDEAWLVLPNLLYNTNEIYPKTKRCCCDRHWYYFEVIFHPVKSIRVYGLLPRCFLLCE